MDFRQSISMHDCLIYADPPYLIDMALYGNKGDGHRGFDHHALADMLNRRGNFVLSYNECDEVKQMYAMHQFEYPEWKYGMSANKKSREMLIISNDIPLPIS